MDKPELGKWMTVKGRLLRRKAGKYPFTRSWITLPTTHQRMMYIGSRTLKNGTVEYMGEGEGTYFMSTEHFEAWLFVASDRCKPIRVLPEQVSE